MCDDDVTFYVTFWTPRLLGRFQKFFQSFVQNWILRSTMFCFFWLLLCILRNLLTKHLRTAREFFFQKFFIFTGNDIAYFFFFFCWPNFFFFFLRTKFLNFLEKILFKFFFQRGTTGNHGEPRGTTGNHGEPQCLVSASDVWWWCNFLCNFRTPRLLGRFQKFFHSFVKNWILRSLMFCFFWLLLWILRNLLTKPLRTAREFFFSKIFYFHGEWYITFFFFWFFLKKNNLYHFTYSLNVKNMIFRKN